MSSSLLPAALRRRRMGLALGLDIGSLLLSYRISHARKELTSSVGWSIVEGWTFFQRHGSQLSDSKLSNNQSGVRTRLNWTFNKLAFPCKLAVAFSARYSIQNPPLIINGAIVCVGGLFPTPPCLAKTHISQSKFRQLEESKKWVCRVWVIHRAIVDRGATQGGFSRHLPSTPPTMWLLTVCDQLF